MMPHNTPVPIVFKTGERIAVTTWTDEWGWRCPGCGWLGIGLMTADYATKEAERHECDAP